MDKWVLMRCTFCSEGMSSCKWKRSSEAQGRFWCIVWLDLWQKLKNDLGWYLSQGLRTEPSKCVFFRNILFKTGGDFMMVSMMDRSALGSPALGGFHTVDRGFCQSQSPQLRLAVSQFNCSPLCRHRHNQREERCPPWWKPQGWWRENLSAGGIVVLRTPWPCFTSFCSPAVWGAPAANFLVGLQNRTVVGWFEWKIGEESRYIPMKIGDWSHGAAP